MDARFNTHGSTTHRLAHIQDGTPDTGYIMSTVTDGTADTGQDTVHQVIAPGTAVRWVSR